MKEESFLFVTGRGGGKEFPRHCTGRGVRSTTEETYSGSSRPPEKTAGE